MDIWKRNGLQRWMHLICSRVRGRRPRETLHRIECENMVRDLVFCLVQKLLQESSENFSSVFVFLLRFELCIDIDGSTTSFPLGGSNFEVYMSPITALSGNTLQQLANEKLTVTRRTRIEVSTPYTAIVGRLILNVRSKKNQPQKYALHDERT